jgi:ribulose-5-phosphate 4-epimerase/fuculose-1-phosphate aldolase
VSADVAAARVEIARACRLLAYQRLADDVLGHVSLRVGDEWLLVRCRGAQERGLRFSTPDDVRLVDFDGHGELDSHRPPAELPIHTEIYRRRQDVQAVVHAHPRAVVAAGLAGLPWLPLVGAFDIPATRLAEEGIAVYPRSVLIHRPELGRELAAALGDRNACVLFGHGLVTTGDTVASAMVRALQVDSLARLALTVVGAGGTLAAVPEADRAELPDLGLDFTVGLLWRHHLASLAAGGWDLDGTAGQDA